MSGHRKTRNSEELLACRIWAAQKGKVLRSCSELGVTQRWLQGHFHEIPHPLWGDGICSAELSLSPWSAGISWETQTTGLELKAVKLAREAACSTGKTTFHHPSNDREQRQQKSKESREFTGHLMHTFDYLFQKDKWGAPDISTHFR